MARNEIFISAPPGDVFAVLSDPRTYAQWVPGTRSIRAADGDWPAEGAALDHSVGPRRGGLSDHTSVTAVLAPVMIELHANARPFGAANVVVQLQPERDGTRVILIEEPSIKAVSVLIGPLGHGLLRVRNAEALRRLKDLAEGHAPRPAGRLPERQEHDARRHGAG